VDERERLKAFEQTVLPHLDAAYNLARWLAGNDHDAQDVTQEASLRAFKFFGSFRGENRARVAAHDCPQHVLQLAAKKTVRGKLPVNSMTRR
jgi:hypothetical protein